MHLLYVDGTVDDLIYGKADWTDLTGESANRYWRWGLDVMRPGAAIRSAAHAGSN